MLDKTREDYIREVEEEGHTDGCGDPNFCLISNVLKRRVLDLLEEDQLAQDSLLEVGKALNLRSTQDDEEIRTLTFVWLCMRVIEYYAPEMMTETVLRMITPEN